MPGKKPVTNSGKRLDQKTRDKIQASNIVHRLVKHVEGEIELSATQITAAKVLLNKVLPDLKAVEHGVSGDNKVRMSFEIK